MLDAVIPFCPMNHKRRIFLGSDTGNPLAHLDRRAMNFLKIEPARGFDRQAIFVRILDHDRPALGISHLQGNI